MKKEDRSTDLYSLAEIKNVRKEENFGKGYIAGKYGAIPIQKNTVGNGDYDPGNCDPAELEAIERLTKEKNECEKARKEAHDTLMHLVFNH